MTSLMGFTMKPLNNKEPKLKDLAKALSKKAKKDDNKLHREFDGYGLTLLAETIKNSKLDYSISLSKLIVLRNIKFKLIINKHTIRSFYNLNNIKYNI